MNVTFLLTIDSEAVDPQALQQTADDIHFVLENEFDVVDIKAWARPSVMPSIQPITGAPPVSGAL